MIWNSKLATYACGSNSIGLGLDNPKSWQDNQKHLAVWAYNVTKYHYEIAQAYNKITNEAGLIFLDHLF